MEQSTMNEKEILETQISEIQQTQAGADGGSMPRQSMADTANAGTGAKQGGKGWKIATVFMAILAIAGIAFGIFEMLDANKKSDKLAQCTQEDNCLDAAAADTTDAEVRNLIDELEKDLAFENRVYKVWGNYSLAVQEEGMKTHMALSKGYGLAFAYPDNLPVDIESRIITQLTQHSFVEQGEADVFGSSTLYANEENGIVCSVDGSAFPLLCGHISWIDEDEIELNNELAEAFYKKEGKYPFLISAGEIQNSSVSPYQRIGAGVDNGAGLFYRVDEDSEWQYFTVTQTLISCDFYDTDDVKKAFAGDRCYVDEATGAESTVQP